MKKSLLPIRIMALTLSMVILLTLTTGCGAKPENASQTADNKASEETASAEPAYKKDLVVAAGTKITNTDPQSINNVQHKRLFLLTHDTLAYYDNEKKEIIPSLATSWKMYDDNVTWEFKLREGVKFHNGGNFTADDVIFSFERGKKSAIQSARFMFSYIKSMEAVDDYTVKIVLDKPNMDWLQLLSQPDMSILSRQAVEADEKKGPEIGTGTWVHKEFADSDYVLLSRFNDYWGELPKAETLKLVTIPEDSARLIALQNGEIDVCIDPNNSELNIISDDPKLELIQYKGTNLVYFAFNVSKAPGNDQKLRQAIAYAINYDDVIKASYEGLAEKASSFWGWHQYGYAEDIEGYNYDLERAKKLMSESGYPNGTKLEIMTNGQARVIAAQVIQAQLKEIGVEVAINEVDSAGFTAQTNAGEHESCLYGITYLTYGDDARRTYTFGSTTNKSFQNNARIHELMDLSLEEPDPKKRLSYYHEWQEIANEEVAVIPVCYPLGAMGINKNVDGIEYEPGGIHNFKNLSVAE